MTGFSYFFFISDRRGGCELATNRRVNGLFRIGIKNTKVVTMQSLTGLRQDFSRKYKRSDRMNHAMESLLELAIILVAAKLAGDLAARFGQPSVLGKLLAGVLIGPAVAGWVKHSDIVEVFAQIGVLLLMFLAGLETDLKALDENRNASVAVAVGGILFPLAGGYIVGIWLGMEQGHAIFLGLLLSATSVSISVQTFRELGKLNSRESMPYWGQRLLTIFWSCSVLRLWLGC